MKKSDKIALLKELQMDEPTFYAKFGGPQDLATQHPELFFKYCMGGRMKKQTGGNLVPTSYINQFSDNVDVRQSDQRPSLSSYAPMYTSPEEDEQPVKVDKKRLRQEQRNERLEEKQKIKNSHISKYRNVRFLQTGGMPPEMQQAMMQQQAPAPQQGGGGVEQAMQQIAQMLQQGMPPEQIIQQLVQSGVPQEQAVQMVQQVAQSMQGEAPQQGAPMMQTGGRMKFQTGSYQPPTRSAPSNQLDPNKYSSDYAFNLDNTDNSKPTLNKNKGTTTLGYASAVAGVVPDVINTVNYAKQGNTDAAVESGMNAVENVVGMAVPVYGAVKQIVGPIADFADTIGEGKDRTIQNDKGETATQHKNEASQVTGDIVSHAFSPSEQVTSAGQHFASGEDDWWKGFIDLLPFGNVATKAMDREDDNKAYNKMVSDNMNYDIDAQARFQSKYGGKWKGQTGGSMTGQDALKQLDWNKLNQPAMNLLQTGGYNPLAPAMSFQTGGLPPEMMAAMQQGDPSMQQGAPQQAPPEPYKPGYRDISPSASIDSSLKPISYKGRTHKYGGIEVTDNSELENGEYSVNLTDPQTGAPQRYIFSNATGFAAKAKKILKDYQSQYA